MTEYIETEAREGETEDLVLSALAHGDPYAFIVASDADDDPDEFKLRVATSLPDAGVVKRLLEKTLRATP